MVIVGLSVIATVLVLQYHHHDPDGGKMPKWVSVVAPLLCDLYCDLINAASHTHLPQGTLRNCGEQKDKLWTFAVIMRLLCF